MLKIGDKVRINAVGKITGLSPEGFGSVEFETKGLFHPAARTAIFDEDEILAVEAPEEQNGSGSSPVARKPSTTQPELKELPFMDGKCPDCGHEEFWEGPSGGGAVNICCKHCQKAFCFSLPGRLSRISNAYFLTNAPKRDFDEKQNHC